MAELRRVVVTAREREIVELVRADQPTVSIALTLGIGQATVNQTLRRVIQRNSLHTRLGLIRQVDAGGYRLRTPGQLRMAINRA
jgi:DNA-binding CsgD family transcriptional regulator